MIAVAMKLITRDPLKKMLYDTPLEIIREGAESGTQGVAEYVKGTAEINAPWDSGMTSNAHEVWRPKRIPKTRADQGVIAQRRVGVSARPFRRHYYPLSVHFGWKTSSLTSGLNRVEGTEVEPNPWLIQAMEDSRGEGLAIFRQKMKNRLNKGVPRGRRI